MKIAGILFDKDGTLFDFNATWGAWAETFLDDLARGDRELTLRLATAIGYDQRKATFLASSPVIAGIPSEIAECLLPFMPGASPSSLISHMNLAAAEAPQIAAVPLQPLLGSLRARGVKLGVATNDAIVPARAHLRSAGIVDLFDFVSGSDSGFGAKPHPGPCFAFAEATRLPPSRIAMVGDSRHDLLAGRAAGMITVAVESGLNDPYALASLADFVMGDIGELPEWLEKQELLEPTAA